MMTGLRWRGMKNEGRNYGPSIERHTLSKTMSLSPV
jgi:hypothetical protein